MRRLARVQWASQDETQTLWRFTPENAARDASSSLVIIKSDKFRLKATKNVTILQL
jgi:hypothetical protein